MAFNGTYLSCSQRREVTVLRRTLVPMAMLTALLTMLGVLAGCASTSAPRHESQLAPGADLSAYSTFGWGPGVNEGTVDEPLRILDVNIRNALRTEMTRRGYQEVEKDPGLLIDYDAAAQDKIRSSPFRIGIGVGSFGSNVAGSVNVGTPSIQNYVEGRLVVHVVDRARNQEVWSGTISGKADTRSLDADAVAKVVALAMEGYPVKAGAP